jgi:hypothetical protein
MKNEKWQMTNQPLRRLTWRTCRPIPTPTRQSLAVRRKSDRPDLLGMAFEFEQFPPGRHLPESDCLIVAGRDQTLIARRKGQFKQAVGVALEFAHELARSGLPEPRRLIAARGGEVLAVARAGD